MVRSCSVTRELNKIVQFLVGARVAYKGTALCRRPSTSSIAMIFSHVHEIRRLRAQLRRCPDVGFAADGWGRRVLREERLIGKGGRCFASRGWDGGRVSIGSPWQLQDSRLGVVCTGAEYTFSRTGNCCLGDGALRSVCTVETTCYMSWLHYIVERICMLRKPLFNISSDGWRRPPLYVLTF